MGPRVVLRLSIPKQRLLYVASKRYQDSLPIALHFVKELDLLCDTLSPLSKTSCNSHSNLTKSITTFEKTEKANRHIYHLSQSVGRSAGRPAELFPNQTPDPEGM
jgi:hypothetical protein